ncbi:DUF1016 N-terminal domain-containing protein [Nesterenkonia ebinurensis]|uniref:DUF1016 N-terminal domain-containing protein n=1 Tax=Nesterenkonia ebinurensis TaxID=2608252 RepID=UPI0037C9516B
MQTTSSPTRALAGNDQSLKLSVEGATTRHRWMRSLLRALGRRQMGELERSPKPDEDDLLGQISSLVEQTRTLVAAQTNAALTMMNWEIGRLINTEVLGQQRAEYAEVIVAAVRSSSPSNAPSRLRCCRILIRPHLALKRGPLKIASPTCQDAGLRSPVHTASYVS